MGGGGGGLRWVCGYGGAPRPLLVGGGDGGLGGG